MIAIVPVVPEIIPNAVSWSQVVRRRYSVFETFKNVLLTVVALVTTISVPVTGVAAVTRAPSPYTLS